ncbi:protein phosphatase 1 regulatory subunit 3C-B-like [Halichoeres trimaculatus]|uniref:protein phosphatase 1 regulatory subunit 3C-B-like n=1 Tax=Halichoeres trimaculatus TaxID=147232 RepID=UPI003D9E976A
MSETRVLRMLNPRPGGPSPIMSVDVAVRICLASSPPLHTLLSNYDNVMQQRPEPLRPCLSSSRCDDSFSVAPVTTPCTTASTEAEDGPMWLRKREKKKNVVFADSRGLSLTAVHVYNESEDDLLTELQFHLSEIEDATARLHVGDITGPEDPGSVLVLLFSQPAADYLDLRSRLKAQQVCLETCSVQDHQLSGTVKVRNLCFDKSVSVRITFDSWRTFQDVPCLYLNNVYSCPDIDTFSFSILVPESLESPNRVEFCIQYQTPDQTYWDNNHGNNYCVGVADPNSAGVAESSAGIEIKRDQARGEKEVVDFDPYGSPRTSAGLFPEWQSWVRVETKAPYW